MKTIPFDIKLRNQIQSEENGYKGRYKVQTRKGEPARIICWDKKGSEFPIVALVERCDSNEASLLFCYDGKFYTDGGESGEDLYLVDTWKFIPKESELKEFEKELANRIYKSLGAAVCMEGIEFLAKKLAPKLLELAKKEIIEKLKEE